MEEILQTGWNPRKGVVRQRVFRVCMYVLLVVLAVILVFPYFYMVMRSLMTSEEVVDPQLRIFPAVPQFVNYVTLFSQSNYFKATLHSLTVIVFNIVAIPLSASIVAFSFAKLQWKGRNVMFALMLSTLMLPAVATQTSLYIMYADFGWIDTLYPFTIPNLFGGGAINIFLLRQVMMGVPKDMDNAAKIDGAGTFRRYFSITLPLCKSVLVYIMVTTFISFWGDYYGPLIYMSTDSAPETLALVLFKDAMEANASSQMVNIRMAGGVFMSLFPAVLFAFFQKQLIEGVVMTGIKG